MNTALEVRKTPDGRIQARRLDGKPLTAQDREEARRQTEPERIAASVLAENNNGDARHILDVWQRIFGMTLDGRAVADHLKRLRMWERSRLKQSKAADD